MSPLLEVEGLRVRLPTSAGPATVVDEVGYSVEPGEVFGIAGESGSGKSMSVLALLGLRYPQRMLPILLFEVGWKLTWLGLVALPLWLDGNLTGATREQAAAVLWVAIVIAVVPWRHVVRQFATARGERWR